MISKTYGDALFELALEENAVDSLAEEVQMVLNVLDENEDLMKLLHHPKIVKEEKIKIIQDIFKGRVSDNLTGFLEIIVDKDRYNEIPSIFRFFLDLVKEYKNIGVAYVTTAVELKDAQKEELKKRLLETTKYETFEMHYQIDASLIGGMMIRIGDRVVDSSIKSKLEEMSRNLMKIQLKL